MKASLAAVVNARCSQINDVNQITILYDYLVCKLSCCILFMLTVQHASLNWERFLNSLVLAYISACKQFVANNMRGPQNTGDKRLKTNIRFQVELQPSICTIKKVAKQKLLRKVNTLSSFN